MAQLVALIRAINLGPRNRVPMAELRDVLAGLGYEDVRTVLASGNVVLRSSGSAEQAGEAIERGIAERFGVQTDVVMRTAAELREVVDANPLGGVAEDGSRYFVSFLAGRGAAPALDFDPADYLPERVEVRGREIYFWCADGLRESRLMKALNDTRLGRKATVRNWNTVTKIHALLDP